MEDRVVPLRIGHQLGHLAHAVESGCLAAAGDERLQIDVVVQPGLDLGHGGQRHHTTACSTARSAPVMGASRSIGAGPLPRATPSASAAPTAASAAAGS